MTHTLSLTGRHWGLPHDQTSLQHRSRALLALFTERGIHPGEQPASAKERRINPSIYPDMARACGRIQQALEKGERIALFGDYDCDGITAIAQLTRYFRRQGVEPAVHLPHRIHDGYGLNQESIKKIIDQEVSLLITADTGIKSVDEIALIQSKGIDVIVTDHHSPGEEVSGAYAILHPALAPKHPQPHPSGAGVILQLLRGLQGDSWQEMEIDIALASIGTVADLVELRGANRALVQEGTTMLSALRDHPLIILADTHPISSTDIAFRIAPKINAAGRLADPSLALEAILEGGKALQDLEILNTERQEKTAALYATLIASIDSDRLFLCKASKDFHPGIIGLLAGKLTENFGRPSLIAFEDTDEYRGSLRSVPGVNVTDALAAHADLLTSFGGHAGAAGCTLKKENWKALCEALNEDLESSHDTQALTPTWHVDATITCDAITPALIADLDMLEPFGQGNPEPLFLLEDIHLQERQLVGRDRSHLKASIGDISCIGFGLGPVMHQTEGPLDLLCHLSLNRWNGRSSIQLRIVDARIHIQEKAPKAPSTSMRNTI